MRAAFIEQRADGYTLLPFGGGKLKGQGAVVSLMSSVNMRAALKLARAWFDVIVIDGPPVLEAPHARFLAREADDVLFLVEWEKAA